MESAAAGSGLAVHDEVDELESSGGGVVNTDSWHISVRFGCDVLRGGVDPLSFIRYLAGLGEIIGIEAIADAIPCADEMDPESCYMGFEIRLQTKSSKADIGRVFDFVRDECDLRILPPHSNAAESIVVVQFGGQRAGIVVDQLMGEFQTVIKPLGRMFSQPARHRRFDHSGQRRSGTDPGRCSAGE